MRTTVPELPPPLIAQRTALADIFISLSLIAHPPANGLSSFGLQPDRIVSRAPAGMFLGSGKELSKHANDSLISSVNSAKLLFGTSVTLTIYVRLPAH